MQTLPVTAKKLRCSKCLENLYDEAFPFDSRQKTRRGRYFVCINDLKKHPLLQKKYEDEVLFPGHGKALNPVIKEDVVDTLSTKTEPDRFCIVCKKHRPRSMFANKGTRISRTCDDCKDAPTLIKLPPISSSIDPVIAIQDLITAGEIRVSDLQKMITKEHENLVKLRRALGILKETT